MPEATTMKALVYHGPGDMRLDDVPRPTLQAATDAVVRMTRTTICGTDLHILKGEVPTVAAGRILGHEGIGVIVEVGPAVEHFKCGDRVVMSCITSCGRCEFCLRGITSHCAFGGWVLGHTIHGTQAELVRIPFADTSLYAIPDGMDEDAMVLLSDILPTGYECGVLNGAVKADDTVAIVGAGPIGLAALLTLRFPGPAKVIVVDVDAHRLEIAKQLGATSVIDNSDGDAAAQVMELTGGRGVDVAIEAVGVSSTFDICQEIVGVGGHIANIGVHAGCVPLHLERLWSQNITITTGLVDAVTTPFLLASIEAGSLDPARLVSHHFTFADVQEAYDTFKNAGSKRALKVIVTSP